jgi:hypothetical protein
MLAGHICFAKSRAPLVALRHLSINSAKSGVHVRQFSPKQSERHVCKIMSTATLSGKSYFGKTGLERVPIVAPAPSATVGPPQGAEMMVHAIAFT